MPTYQAAVRALSGDVIASGAVLPTWTLEDFEAHFHLGLLLGECKLLLGETILKPGVPLAELLEGLTISHQEPPPHVASSAKSPSPSADPSSSGIYLESPSENSKEISKLDPSENEVFLEFQLVRSPATLVVTASEDLDIKVWNAETGYCARTFGDHINRLQDFAVSPSGLVASCAQDCMAYCYDPRSGVKTAVLDGHDSSVSSIQFSADGARILTSSSDGTARLWDRRNFLHVGGCFWKWLQHADHRLPNKETQVHSKQLYAKLSVQPAHFPIKCTQCRVGQQQK